MNCICGKGERVRERERERERGRSNNNIIEYRPLIAATGIRLKIIHYKIEALAEVQKQVHVQLSLGEIQIPTVN